MEALYKKIARALIEHTMQPASNGKDVWMTDRKLAAICLDSCSKTSIKQVKSLYPKAAEYMRKVLKVYPIMRYKGKFRDSYKAFVEGDEKLLNDCIDKQIKKKAQEWKYRFSPELMLAITKGYLPPTPIRQINGGYKQLMESNKED